MTKALLIIDVQKAILAGAGTAARQPVLDRALDEVVGRLQAVRQRARAQAFRNEARELRDLYRDIRGSSQKTDRKVR